MPIPLDKLSDDALAVITIWGEARGEPPVGQAAVGSVIKNRMLKKHNSDGTMQGTVLRPRQFDVFNPGNPNLEAFEKMIDTMKPGSREEKDLQAIQKVWQQVKDRPSTFDANLYHAKGTMPSWAKSPKVKKVATIGNHIFYKEKR